MLYCDNWQKRSQLKKEEAKFGAPIENSNMSVKTLSENAPGRKN
jgi:hypothetical protein